jgi:hypothetical protein
MIGSLRPDPRWMPPWQTNRRGEYRPSRLPPPCRSRHIAAASRALVGCGRHHHPAGMFVVTEAVAIRAAFDRGGELSAAVELRRLFPGVPDTATAREFARTIAAWKPLPAKPRLVRLLGKGR